MPPVGARLTSAEVATLRAWIDQGAPWAASGKTAGGGNTHWAFRKVTRPEAPAVRDRAWPRNAIDRFVLGARWNPRVSRRRPKPSRTTLIRRVSLDLTGLPPTPQEVEAFLSDNRPDAYERLVDRLLASPHYGEKLGAALARPGALRRQRRLREGPAAALCLALAALGHRRAQPRHAVRPVHRRATGRRPAAERDARQLIATGFHRNTLTNREGGVDPEEFRVEQVATAPRRSAPCGSG